MDLGATVCTPRAPLCLACPVSDLCHARRDGLQDDLPRPLGPEPAPGGRRGLRPAHRRPRPLPRRPPRPRPALGTLPRVPHRPPLRRRPRRPRPRRPRSDLAPRFEALTGISLRLGPALHTLRYGVTSHRVTLTAFSATPTGGSPPPAPASRPSTGSPSTPSTPSPAPAPPAASRPGPRRTRSRPTGPPARNDPPAMRPASPAQGSGYAHAFWQSGCLIPIVRPAPAACVPSRSVAPSVTPIPVKPPTLCHGPSKVRSWTAEAMRAVRRDASWIDAQGRSVHRPAHAAPTSSCRPARRARRPRARAPPSRTHSKARLGRPVGSPSRPRPPPRNGRRVPVASS